MPIRQLLKDDQHFGPEDIKLLSSVFEEALRELRLVDRTDPATQTTVAVAASLLLSDPCYRALPSVSGVPPPCAVVRSSDVVVL